MSAFLRTGADGSDDEQPDLYRVMIVDDSAFIRGAIARAIEGDPALKIVSSVSNGEQAIRSLQREAVDVIVLDIEMPIMDGMTALPKLKEIDAAVQIIMASTLTQKNAEISLKAMSLGATDYIPKPSSGHEVNAAEDFRRELIGKIKALGALARRSEVRGPYLKVGGAAAPIDRPKTEKRPSDLPQPAQVRVRPDGVKVITPPPAGVKKEIILRKEPIISPEVLAIGSSTGGPQALFRVIKDMGPDLRQPIVVTQHMPPSFTTILAEHISRQCGVLCKEAQEGDILKAGQYYIAPGDYHMLIETKGMGPTVKLVKDPPENFCRPSVDPMLRSLVNVYGKKILVIILTGMGQDGTRGSEVVVGAGGSVIAQDEATSVVWGMPGAVAMSGLCSSILPVGEIGGFVRQAAMRIRT